MERKTIAALALLTVAVAAVAVGLLATYAEAKSMNQAVRCGFGRLTLGVPTSATEAVKVRSLMNMWRQRVSQRIAKDLGPRVEVSEEFKERVTSIVSNDPDASKLLSEGYNITGIKPVIKAYVGADGTVSLKAVEAVVTLHKSGTGTALVIVNVEQGKVVKIYTYTIIEK